MKTASERIEAALRAARRPLSIDQIAMAALGKAGDAERNTVRVNLYRLDRRGLLIKVDAVAPVKVSVKYKIKARVLGPKGSTARRA